MKQPMRITLGGADSVPQKGIVISKEAQSDAAYFTWDNLSELASLDTHIAFAKKLIDKYQWPSHVRKDLTARLQEIQVKQQDKNLNLSVIGEFSSGKSTFINALLRMNLLAADVLQGTTVASTVIQYGPEYSITWEDSNRPKQTLGFQDFAGFQRRLNQIVADNDQAQGLDEVVVCLPSANLQEGKYRIIDTPGLNATVHWHENVTIRTLQETSDLSIILVDAVRPLPDDLCQFIEEYLEPVLEQCIFVVTKIDLIPPRERNMLLKYVERAVKNRFGVDKPLVLPYSSVDVINSSVPGSYAQGKYDSDVSVSFASEKHIMEHMARQRTIAQTKKLISLIDLIYESIHQQMKQLTGKYEERLALLLRTQQADLSDFIADQKALCTKAYNEEASRIRSATVSAGRDYSSQVRDAILDKIDICASTDSLNNYMHSSVKADCKEQAEALCQKILQKVLNEGKFAAAADHVLKDFRAAFQQKFRKLACLVPEQGIQTITPPQINMPNVKAIELAGEYTQDMVRQENRWAGGGAAAGALAGTAIAPGIGTLIGAAVGFIGGLAGADRAGVNLGEMKNATKRKLQIPLKTYFDDVAMQAYSGVDKYIDGVRRQISTEIDRYLKTYRATVEHWIREEREKKSQLEDKVQGIQADMHQIDIRRQSLYSLRKQIQPNQEAQV